MARIDQEDVRRCFVVEIAGRETVSVSALGADAGGLWSLALLGEIRAALGGAIGAGQIGGYVLDECGNLRPQRATAEFDALKEALRRIDPSTMSTAQVVDLCEANVPGCTIEQIVRALHEVGDEQLQEAERLGRAYSDAGSNRRK